MQVITKSAPGGTPLIGTLSGAGCPCWSRSAAVEGVEAADVVRARVLVSEAGLVRPEEVARVVGRHEVDRARRVAGQADVHAERAELPGLAVVEELDDLLGALDRVARHHEARRLGARDGTLERVGAGLLGHVDERLGADAVVLEGRLGVAVGGSPGALRVDVRERRDGARVADRDGRRRGVGGRRGRVLGRPDARVALSSLRLVVLRQYAGERESGAEGDDERGYDEQRVTLQEVHLNLILTGWWCVRPDAEL